MRRLSSNCNIDELVSVKWYTDIKYLSKKLRVIVLLTVLLTLLTLGTALFPLALVLIGFSVVSSASLLVYALISSRSLEHFRQINLHKLEHEIGKPITVQYLHTVINKIKKLDSIQRRAFIEALERGITKPGYFTSRTSERLRYQLFNPQLTDTERLNAVVGYLSKTLFSVQHTGTRLFCDLVKDYSQIFAPRLQFWCALSPRYALSLVKT